MQHQVQDGVVEIGGFGLVAFASLFPIISVLAYAQATVLYDRYVGAETDDDPTNESTSLEET